MRLTVTRATSLMACVWSKRMHSLSKPTRRVLPWGLTAQLSQTIVPEPEINQLLTLNWCAFVGVARYRNKIMKKVDSPWERCLRSVPGPERGLRTLGATRLPCQIRIAKYYSIVNNLLSKDGLSFSRYRHLERKPKSAQETTLVPAKARHIRSISL